MADVFELFLHNWVASLRMETEWATVLEASAEDMIEERLGLQVKPRRTLFPRWDALAQDEAHRLFFGLARSCGQTSLLVPIYQDVAVTTASSSGTTVNAPTGTRRLVAGQQVFVFQTARGRPTNVQRRTVNAVLGAASFSVTSALTGSFPAGSYVVPLAACRPLLRAAGSAITDGKATSSLAFVEALVDAVDGAADYDGLAADGLDTGESAEGLTYYVLPVGPNWGAQVDLGAERSGNEVELGRDHVVIPRGPRARFTFRWTVLARDRGAAWAVLRFFDGHRGRLVPFFVANPLSLWTVTNAAVGWVEVTRAGDMDDPSSFASYLFLETTAGVRYVREISGVTDSSGANRIAVTPDLPLLTAGQVARATTAHLCRFQSDALREEWACSSVASFEVAVEEVLNEVGEVTL